MNLSLTRAFAIARKEIYHILRDPFTLGLSLGLPVFLVFTFGFAIEINTLNLPISVYDEDHSLISRSLIETFTSSQYFIPTTVSSPEEGQDSLASEKTHAVLIIPPSFQEKFLSGKSPKTQMLLDGSDNSTVGPILSYMSIIQTLAAKRLTKETVGAKTKSSPVITRFLFNPELNSKWFVIPGLTVVVMSILSILLTALTVAREWENGSMELLLSTPIRPLEIILGKLAPYGFMAMIAVVFVYTISRLVFHIPFQGSLFVFSLGGMIFLLTYLSQGLLISVLTRKQQMAMQLAILSGMLPSQLLSGFIFPIASMPEFFHYFTMIFPARWFMVIARQSYLKGSLFSEMWAAFLGLSVLCVVMMTLATKRFKRDLEP
jgi:ABC-2 type transport system permease protein